MTDDVEVVARADEALEAEIKQCIDELLNKDDRTSPEEWPEMMMLTANELATYMRRAVVAACPPVLSGTWRTQAAQNGAWVLEVELPCINGLSAWFSVATFHAAENAERLMTDGARQEAGDYAAKFGAAMSAAPRVAALESALEEVLSLMEVADNALDRDTEEQMRKIYDYDPPDDAEFVISAKTRRLITVVFERIEKFRTTLSRSRGDAA